MAGRPAGIAISEVECSTLIHRMRPTAVPPEYTLNVYRGCLHGCAYCYAPSLTHDERPWGEYVEVKVNAPKVLERELRGLEKGVVFLSSASDPYQPVEAKYGLTRACLKVLLDHGFPVAVLTRSHLVLRDIDLFKRFEWVRVGVSVTTVPNRLFEPRVPPLERRIETLRRLAEEGIYTWVSFAPIIPGLIMVDPESLLRRLREVGVRGIHLGLLRLEGYEQSKRMFEERAGASYRGVMLGAQAVMRTLRRLAEELGFEQNVFDWRANHTIEEYIEGGGR